MVTKNKARNFAGTPDEAPDAGKYPEYSGANNGKLVAQPVPKFVKTEGEHVKQGPGNQWMVFGRDRCASRGSGYGGAGDTHCDSIDIVVGRMATQANSNFHVDPVFADQMASPYVPSDAARIYISQKTDIDKNFKLKSGPIGVSPSVGKSAIGIKADAIRIMSREGIKIVTGCDMKNSQNAPLDAISGIDLIAGNLLDGQYNLEPLVKGGKLLGALLHLTFLIEKVISQVDSNLKTQMEFNMAVGTHFHNSPFSGMTTTNSIDLSPGAAKEAINHLQQNVSQLKSLRQNIKNFKSNFLYPSGEHYINSRKNNTN